MSFQENWYCIFPWLHFENDLQKFVCLYCWLANQHGLVSLAQHKESAFINKGFSGNWNHALLKFREHQQSEAHHSALFQSSALNKPSIISQLSVGHEVQQARNRQALLRISSAVRLCGVTGIALRGHEQSSGNLNAILDLLRTDVPELKEFLSRGDKRNQFTSWQIQNELLKIMAHQVQRKLIQKINHTKYFSLIVDETTDIAGREQVTFCVRYVSENLEPAEVFLAINDTSSTTGEELTKLILCFLQQLGLPISMLRGQCYDGAANMCGQFKGVKARIMELNAKALFVHCVSHNLNLVLQDTSRQVTLVRDALQVVHEVGKLISDSANRINCLKKMAEQKDIKDYSIPKPLCLTRWVARSKSLKQMTQPDQYRLVMSTLYELSKSSTSGESGAKAAGLLSQLEKASTYLGIYLCEEVFSKTEFLATRLQEITMTVAGSKVAANAVIDFLQVYSIGLYLLTFIGNILQHF
jgi:hypothetical protein